MNKPEKEIPMESVHQSFVDPTVSLDNGKSHNESMNGIYSNYSNVLIHHHNIERNNTTQPSAYGTNTSSAENYRGAGDLFTSQAPAAEVKDGNNQEPSNERTFQACAPQQQHQEVAAAPPAKEQRETYTVQAPTEVLRVTPPEMNELVQLMAFALQHRCELHRHAERSHQSIFHSTRIPGIFIWDYVRRIARYSGCSPECFIIALVLLDRYYTATNIPLTFRNAHRLIITAVMISAKLRDDVYYSNAYFASIGGVSSRELNHLELEMLITVKWFTWVEPILFFESVNQLKQYYGSFLLPWQNH